MHPATALPGSVLGLVRLQTISMILEGVGTRFTSEFKRNPS